MGNIHMKLRPGQNSLRHGKRFRLVSEALRKTEERDLVLAAREMKRQPKPHGNACYAG